MEHLLRDLGILAAIIVLWVFIAIIMVKLNK